MNVLTRTLFMQGHRRQTAALLLASAAVLACAPNTYAQFRASITGSITDQTGAVVSGVSITLKDNQTGKTLSATSNGAGIYNFNALPPDTFTLSAVMPGFQTKTIDDLTITPEQSNNINVVLQVGATAQTVTVNADTIPPLDTATASISGTISANDIQHLPSAGRDVFQLAQLTPGAFGDGQRGGGGGTNSLPGTQGPGGSGNTGGSFSTENGPQVLSNGGQYETNSVNIDGISTVSAVWGGTSIITPNEDSIDNVKITSNGYDAEFGRFSGANLQVTTKSGTNQVHGSFFFRVARPGLNAFQRYNGPNSLNPATLGTGVANTNVNRAAARGLLRDTARYNDFGGSIGGPILRNRVFAFFAYETIRNNSTATDTHWYETNAFDASAPAANISNKYTTFAGHSPVGATMINSTCATAGLTEGVNCRTIVGQGLDIGSPLKTARGTQDPTYVTNNNPGTGSGLDNIADIADFQTNTPSTTTQVQYNGRLDGDVTNKDHLAFAIYWVPQTQHYINGAARGYNQWNHNQINDAFSVIYNHTFSSNFLNEARANAAGWRWNEVTDNPQAPFGLPTDTVNAPGSTNLEYFGASGPSHLNQWTYGYKDVATRIVRNHSIKFGGDATQLHYLQDAVYAARPSFNFYNVWNFLNDAPYQETGTFDRFTGIPFSNRFDQREWIYGGFVQDDWKATPNLTINAGIRYNYFDALYSKQNNLPHPVFGANAGGLYTGIQLIRGGKSWTPDAGNFGPQFGFAYNPDLFNKRVVIRGGYGLNFNQEEIAISANQSNSPNDAVSPNFNNSTPITADTRIQYNVPADSKSLFGYAPNTNTITAYGANGLPLASGFQITAVPNHLRTQQVHHYSLQVEGDLGHQLVASALYQGSTARHLIYHQDAYLYGLYHGATFNSSIPYIEYFGDTGQSNYNALILDVKHNMAHNFSVDASFTYAKSMDDNSGPYEQDPYTYNPTFSRGRSDFNVGKAFKVFGTYNPKFYYGGNAFAKVLLNGFNISGIYNLHTGFPWTPLANYGTSAYYTQANTTALRPTSYTGTAGNDHSNKAFASTTVSKNFTGGPQNFFGVYDQTTITNSSSAFPTPISFYPTPGLARNSFTGPHYQGLDATVTKAFGIPNRYLGERTGIEFRVDAFNVLNITNLVGGTASLNGNSGVSNLVQTVTNGVITGNPTFGISTAGLAGRQVQMQARLNF